MMDPAALFGFARRLADAAGYHRVGVLRPVLGLLPMRAVGEAWWEPIEPKLARARDIRPVVAVRAGAVPPGLVVRDAVHGVAQDAARAAWWQMMAGEDIVDLLACDWGLSKPPRRLLGQALALGDPNGMRAEEGEPVHIARGVAEALTVPGLVLPLGDAGERAAYLRGCAGGIVARDLDHGAALKKAAVVPPVAAPQLFVVAA
jgi:hypothetical protein